MKQRTSHLTHLVTPLLACASACQGDVTGPSEGGGDLIVSEVSSVPQSTQAHLRSGLVYISLASGAVPGGAVARARNLNSSATATGPMIDGGLDPLPLAAEVGDEIELVATDSASGVFHMREKVRPRRPPVVVRTSPPRGRTDVPLNSVIVIVFSEPVDPASLHVALTATHEGITTATSVRVLPGGTHVEVTPAASLAPLTQYDLRVTNASDVAGDALEDAVDVTFTTGDSEIATVVIEPASGVWPAGSMLQLRARTFDARGRELQPAGMRWESLHTARALVHGGTGDVLSVSAGEAVIQAIVGNLSAVATLRFDSLSFAHVSAGDDHTCGTLEHSRGVACWGSNDSGQLPQAERAGAWDFVRPVHAPELGRASALDAGGAQTCAAFAIDVVCWGRAPASLTMAVRSLSTGWGDAVACAVRDDSTLDCWGNWVISGATTVRLTEPTRVEGSARYERVTAGHGFFCALAGTQAFCSGSNSSGQLGVGDFKAREFASSGGIRVYPLKTAAPIRRISAGRSHACAVAVSGDVWCWGSNDYGELGRVSDASSQPVRVSLPVGADDIAVGDRFSCAVGSDEEIYCWGRNEWGQLGFGGYEHSAVPRLTLPERTPTRPQRFTGVTAGRDHACGYGDGKVQCWGRNDRGQLGNGTTLSSPIPKRLALQFDPDR